MTARKIIKRILNFFGWLAIFVGVVFLVFGFGEDGIDILSAVEFWSVVNFLWLSAILLFVIENRIKKQ